MNVPIGGRNEADRLVFDHSWCNDVSLQPARVAISNPR